MNLEFDITYPEGNHPSSDQLYNYASGILFFKAREDIEAHLAICEVCKAEVLGIDFYRTHESDDKAEFDMWASATVVIPKKKPIVRKILFLSTTSLALVATIALLITFSPAATLNRNIYITERDATVQVYRDAAESYPEKLKELYDGKSYEEVISMAQGLDEIEPNTQFYIGLSYLQLYTPELGLAKEHFLTAVGAANIKPQLAGRANLYLAQIAFREKEYELAYKYIEVFRQTYPNDASAKKLERVLKRRL